MDSDRRQQIQERVEKQYATLKENEAHHAMLRDRSIGGYAPRPSPQLIEASIGTPPKIDRQLRQQARDHVAKELKTERRLAARQQNLQNSQNTHQASNQNATERTADTKEQHREAMRNKLKRDHQNARTRSNSR